MGPSRVVEKVYKRISVADIRTLTSVNEMTREGMNK